MIFRELIDNNKDLLVEKLQGCVRIPSVEDIGGGGYPFGENVHNCLHYMLDLSREMGFRTYNMDEHVGWCEYGDGEEMVAVLGHLDVVPEGDGWSVEPYAGIVKDGRIYGRGTSDDKGPTMAALFALKAIKDSGVKLKRRIRIIFGLNEETGSADMKYYSENGGETPIMGFTPDAEYPVINGEKGIISERYVCKYVPEGNIRIKEIWGGTAHNIVPDYAYAVLNCDKETAEKITAVEDDKIKVSAFEDGVKVEAYGVSAHGGSPHLGENAIGRLLLFMTKLSLQGKAGAAIAFLAEKLGMECDGKSIGIAMSDEVSGKLSMNFGVIRGNEETIEVTLNYRYPVTKKYEMCGPIVQKAFTDAGFDRTWILHHEGIYMPPESELVQKLMKVYAENTGDYDSKPKCIGGGTYAKSLPNVLAFGSLFPGDEGREHKADEFVEIRRLIENANIIADAMYALAND